MRTHTVTSLKYLIQQWLHIYFIYLQNGLVTDLWKLILSPSKWGRVCSC